MLAIGDRLPAGIELPDASGVPVALDALRSGRNLVLYFYPRDDTPGCTAEACSFRDQYEDFVDAGAVVVGVSPDTPERHASFAARHNLPFTLLADRRGHVARQLGVPKRMGLIPGRVTFIVDMDGVVRHIFDSQVQATRHVREALATLRSLA
jgi:peroxiredoxin Q/BCP